MIKSVNRVEEGTYIINNSVKMHNVELDGSDIIYDIDFDEKLISETDAIKCCEEFLKTAINDFVAKMKEQTAETAKIAQTANL